VIKSHLIPRQRIMSFLHGVWMITIQKLYPKMTY
jgi:hypothetical protein